MPSLNHHVLSQPQSRCTLFIHLRCDTFYNISKNIHTGNGASIGKGEKTTFGDKYGFPSPLQYKIKSSFENGNKGIKLSLGR